MAKSSKKALCHPARYRAAKGLCSTCYARLYRATPEGRANCNRNNAKYRKTDKGKTLGREYREEYEKRDYVKLRRELYTNSAKGKTNANARGSKYRTSEKGKQRRRVYENTKVQNDVQFKLGKRLRIRLYHALKKNHKTGSAVSNLGCTLEQFKMYLESQFQPGMTWQNWSKEGWHIDHIKPLDSFDLTDKEQLLKACHYTNLQPLWAFDNHSKGNKY